MSTSQFQLYISYGQLAVFLSSLAQPFNDWLEVHVDQGFAWRLGSVSFRSLAEEGEHSIELVVSQYVAEVTEHAVRAIEVPFEVPADGAVTVASLTEEIPVFFATGSYLLRAEFFPQRPDGLFPVRLRFMLGQVQGASVIRADPELRVPPTLVMTAEAAC